MQKQLYKIEQVVRLHTVVDICDAFISS